MSGFYDQHGNWIPQAAKPIERVYEERAAARSYARTGDPQCEPDHPEDADIGGLFESGDPLDDLDGSEEETFRRNP